MDIKLMSQESRLFEIETIIKKIIIQQFQLDINLEDINPMQDYLIESFGLTSIDALELLLRVEKEFKIEISDEDLSRDLVRNVRSISLYVAKKFDD